MATKQKKMMTISVSHLLLPSEDKRKSIPIYLTRTDRISTDLQRLNKAQLKWLKASGFNGSSGAIAVVPAQDGSLDAAVMGVGKTFHGSAHKSSARLAGKAARQLPQGNYYFANLEEAEGFDAALAALCWGLGAYRFTRYLDKKIDPPPALKLPEFVNHSEISNAVEAIWLGRDLINIPANDMGPDELEAATRALAKTHSAKVSCITGDKLLEKNFPMIHAVGRASSRAPRLLDLQWGKAGDPTVTLVGKGICFDTGGLDIKPANGMLLMKKDMGGAAAVLALAHMIMGQKLPVRLRVLIPAAENSIAANAFRPGDIIPSRVGLSVEIGNTDAEGRLVLADALALADEDKPDFLMTFATLTGAARVALGPDLPPVYVDDDELAQTLITAGETQADPLWRMPFWPDYERMLDSPNADINNTGVGGFAGSITAALFLRRFVSQSPRYTHFDIYGWRPEAGLMGPRGGEVQAVRAVFAALQDMVKA